MTTPTPPGPCGWVIEQCGCVTGTTACWTSHTPATRTRAATLATYVMWAATGRRYGLCPVAVLPCTPPPALPLYETYPVPTSYGTDLLSMADRGRLTWPPSACSCGGRCAAQCEVSLPGPVHSVLEVMVEGQAIAVGVYEIHDGHLLVRTDGLCWPTCQVFGSPIPGFLVTYVKGQPVPAAVQAASETLACQFAAACTGGECQLPGRVTSMSRSGVDITLADIPTEGGKIRTGIQDVDDIIAADNPYGLTSRPEVMSPDLPPQPRTVTWAGGS